MIKKEEEIWRTYPDYPWIEVSNLGRVRTKDRTVTRGDGRKQFVRGRILKQQLKKSGYVNVGFRVNGNYVTLRVHRMVAICFLPNPNDYPEVNHIDCDPANNRAENLEWCTSEYNNAYREKYGTACNHPVIAINPDTGKVFWFESQNEAARKLGVWHQHITKVVKGRYNKTGGYWFCYADEDAVEKARTKFGDKIAEKVKKLIREHI